MSGLGRLYMVQGKHSQAEPLYIKVLDVRRRVLGEQHPDTLTSMDDLASLYRVKASTRRPRQSGRRFWSSNVACSVKSTLRR